MCYTTIMTNVHGNNISLIGYDFSKRVPADEIKNWIEALKKDYHGGIVRGMPEDAANAFFVTDRIERCAEAKKSGVAYLLYLHDGNREGSFADIPYAVTDLEGVDLFYMDKVYCRFINLPWVILETKRCILRELTEDDLDELYEIYRDPSVTLYTEGLYEDREAEHAYIRDYTQQVYRFCGYGIWAVIQKESGRLIGRAGLACREGFDTPELGYVIGTPYQRQGYATEVCRAIVEYAARELGFTTLRVLFREENKASLGLCRKLGFREDREIETDGVKMQQYIYTVAQGRDGRETIEK